MLEKHWAGTTVAHFSCHGSRGERAFLSRLHLRDRALLAHDVLYRLDPLPQGSSVILNACETGGKDLRAMDEAMGLTLAFLQSGASEVLSMHYSVDDLLAAVMAKTYA